MQLLAELRYAKGVVEGLAAGTPDEARHATLRLAEQRADRRGDGREAPRELCPVRQRPLRIVRGECVQLDRLERRSSACCNFQERHQVLVDEVTKVYEQPRTNENHRGVAPLATLRRLLVDSKRNRVAQDGLAGADGPGGQDTAKQLYCLPRLHVRRLQMNVDRAPSHDHVGEDGGLHTDGCRLLDSFALRLLQPRQNLLGLKDRSRCVCTPTSVQACPTTGGADTALPDSKRWCIARSKYVVVLGERGREAASSRNTLHNYLFTTSQLFWDHRTFRCLAFSHCCARRLDEDADLQQLARIDVTAHNGRSDLLVFDCENGSGATSVLPAKQRHLSPSTSETSITLTPGSMRRLRMTSGVPSGLSDRKVANLLDTSSL